MTIDITPLAVAVQRLREGLRRCEQEPNDEQIRDGLIHRFELTYELSHKMLKRYLKQAAPSPAELDPMPFADLIRSGNALVVTQRLAGLAALPRNACAHQSHLQCAGRLGSGRRHSCVSGRGRAPMRGAAKTAGMIDLSDEDRQLVAEILGAGERALLCRSPSPAARPGETSNPH